MEIGDSYEETAIKETKEETGIVANKSDLHFLRKYHKRSEDKSTGMINNAIRTQFVYIYRGKVSDLSVEEGKSLGFEIWPIEKLLSLTDEEKKKFTPGTIGIELLLPLKAIIDPLAE